MIKEQKQNVVSKDNIHIMNTLNQALKLDSRFSTVNYDNMCKKLDALQKEDIRIIKLPVKNNTIIKCIQVSNTDNNQNPIIENSPEEEQTFTYDTGIINFPMIKLLYTLKQLHIEYCTQLQGIEEINNCHGLEKICISNSAIVKFPMIENLQNLKRITIRQCKQFEALDGIKNCQFDKVVVSRLVKSDTESDSNLKFCLTIHIDKCENFHSIGAIQNCTEIQQIEINNLNIKNICQIENLGKLKMISLIKCSKLQLIKQIENCSLEEIKVNSLRINSFQIVQNQTQLKRVDIQDCKELESINEIRNCLELEEIILNQVNIKDISAIKLLKQLKRVTIWNSSKITDYNVFENCTNLNYLCIESTNIADVSSIINLQNIETFKMVNNQQLAQKYYKVIQKSKQEVQTHFKNCRLTQQYQNYKNQMTILKQNLLYCQIKTNIAQKHENFYRFKTDICQKNLSFHKSVNKTYQLILKYLQ